MSFRHLRAALMAVACAVLCAAPAAAQNYSLLDANRNPQTFGSLLLSGVQYPKHVMMGVYSGTPTALSVDASGNLNVNVLSGGGGGGSLSAKANAADQTSAEGATTDPLSMDLSRYLRTRDKSGAQFGSTWGLNVHQIDGGGTSATDDSNHAVRVNVVAGGAGGGAVYGPTAVGSAAANPPVLLGGTATGGATGNVAVAKVTTDGLVHVSVDSGGGTGGTSSSFAAAFPATGTAIGAKNGSNMVNLTTDASNNLNVAVPSGADVVLGGSGDTTCTSGSHTVNGCMYVAATSAGTLGAAATGGATPAFQSALSTTVTQIKASAGSLYMLRCYNPNASVAYVQVFNLPSASVTLGTTTPTASYAIAATSAGGFAMSAIPVGLGGSGISVAATTTATGSTANGSTLTCNLAYQ